MARMPYPGDIYPDETYPSVSQSYVTPYGEWEYVSDVEEQRAIRDAYGRTTFSALVDNPVAGSTYTVDIGGVPGFYDADFFDGATSPDGVFNASWVGIPNDSESVLYAETANDNINYDLSKNVKIHLTKDSPIRGSKSLYVIPTVDKPDVSYQGGSGVPNHKGTCIAFRIPAGGLGYFSLTVRNEKKYGAPIVLCTTDFIPVANSQSVSRFDGTGTTRLMIRVNSSANPRTAYLHLPGDYFGGSVVIDELQHVNTVERDIYFDGSMEDDADIDYAWEGTPHNSRSYYQFHRSVYLPGAPVSPYALQSVIWKHTGTYSLRMIQKGSAIISLNDASQQLLKSGHTYTYSAVRMLKKTTDNIPLPGYEDDAIDANLIVLMGNTSISEVVASSVPSRAGTERLSATFTVPEGNDWYVYLALMGSYSQDTWFDSVMLEESPSAGEYFDGSTPGAEWLGAPDDSYSRLIPVTARGGGYPLKKLVSAYGDRMGEIDELVARLTYLPEDERDDIELLGIDGSNRVVPLGATSDLVDARTADDSWLPWIGQIIGLDSRNLSTDELRNAITSGMTGMVAGTRRAIAGAVRSIMSGDDESRSVRIYPHTSDIDAIGQASQWDLLVVTPTEQNLTQEMVRDVVTRSGAKPAGVVIHHVSRSTTWADLHAKLPTWATWNNKTWENIEEMGF